MRHSHIINWVSDRSFCFISAYFRCVTEEHGVDLNTKNYAHMKRTTCQARTRNLRLLVQSSSSSDNGNSSVRYVNLTHFPLFLPQYYDSIFCPVGVSPSRPLQCPTAPLYERAHATTSAEGSKHQLPIKHCSKKDIVKKRTAFQCVCLITRYSCYSRLYKDEAF